MHCQKNIKEKLQVKIVLCSTSQHENVKTAASLVSLPDRFSSVKIPHAVLWIGGRLGLITSVKYGAKENTFLRLPSGMCVCVCV